MHRGQWVDPVAGRLTLAEWAATYLATVTNLRPTTLATYERDLTRYVLPRFGHLPLARVRPLDVRSWLADELSPPEPGVGGGVDEHPEMRVHLLGQTVDLGGGQETHLDRLDPRGLDPGAR